MIRTLAALALLCLGAHAQAPSFEAATVKPAAPGSRGGRASIAGDRVVYSNTTLLNALVRAFDLKFRGQVIGPAWVFTERYDIVAKAPDNTPKQEIPRMLQALLIERFKLALHRENRDLPAYSLILGKSRLRLKSPADPDAATNGWDLAHGPRAAKNMSMAALADYATLMLGSPVLDKTGLGGYYDFPLELTLEETGGATDRPQPPSIFTLVQDLGLKLEPGKAPFDVVVIESGDKVPIDN